MTRFFDNSKIVSSVFRCFMIIGLAVEFVQEFRYLGHILSCKMRHDSDIKCEIRNMYMGTNMLAQRFKRCSINVKIKPFRAYCICLYGVFLWSCYNVSTCLNSDFVIINA